MSRNQIDNPDRESFVYFFLTFGFSWARHFTLSVSLSPHPVALMCTGEFKCSSKHLRWSSIPSRGELNYSLSLHAMGSEGKFQPDDALRLIYLLRLPVPAHHFVPDMKILSDVECCNEHKHSFL